MPGIFLGLYCLVAVLSLALPVWVLLSTKYSVSENTLIIRSGPMSWSVPVKKITSVQATRNAASSPALSLDRLLINYSGDKSVMVSPKDRAVFLDAIGQEL